MRYIDQLKDYKSKNKTAVTLGKFDGFHRGHQLLIEKIKEHSSAEVDSLLLAFDIGGKGLLTKEEQKEKMREEVDVFISCPLSDEIKKMSPEKFVEEVLVEKLNVKYLVVGADFHFGCDRSGNVSLLEECSGKFGFHLEVIPKMTVDGKEISSTLIKEALEKGEIHLGNQMLGYDYEISGVVRSGKKLGRRLGFPTLNIVPDKRKVLPKYGVYGCKVELEYSKDNIERCFLGKGVDSVSEWKEKVGICNIGTKPTAVDTGQPMAESHVFDFQGEAYGREAKVKLLFFVRPEKKFNSVEELKKQVEQDIGVVKASLQL